MPRRTASDTERGSDAERGSASDDEHEPQERDAHQQDVLAGTQTAEVLQALSHAVAEPSAFVQPSVQIADIARQATKALYDYSLAAAGPSGTDDAAAGGNGALQLHVADFDAEQIWGQLDMHAGPLLRRVKRLIARAGEAEALLQPQAEAQLDELQSGHDGAVGGSSSEEEGAGLRGTTGAAQAADGTEDGEEDEGTAAERRVRFADGAAGAADADGGGRQRGKRKRGGRLPGEDDFMRLADMEAFVQQAERDAMREDEDDEDEGGDSEGDESDEDEGPGLFDAAEPEDDSDAELAAVLDNAAALVGRKRQRTGTNPAAALGDSDSEGQDDTMYDSFFDPKPGDGASAAAFDDRGFGDGGLDAESDEEDSGDGEEGSSDDEELGSEDDARPSDDEWGGELYDTGEGRADGSGAASGGRRLLGAGSDEDSDADDAADGGQRLSKHERRTRAMQERIAAMEAAAMSEKDWFMRGETQAGQRPLNSALELDLDFERTMQPPPAPTEEGTATLEERIRARVAERQWDDVIHIAPPPPDTRKTALELDDKKSGKGLGDLYEEEYMKAKRPTTDAVEERDAAVKAEARSLLKALFAKLDALSHFHFAPKPVVEDMAVRAEVPALALEEVAPQIASEAGMRYAGEVYRPEGKGGAPPAGEGEASREERKRARAAKKRAGKKRTAQKDQERRERSVAAGGTAALPDRKSEAAAKAADQEARKARKSGQRSEFTKSSKMFAKLQDQQVADAAAKSRGGKPAAPPADAIPAARLKL